MFGQREKERKEERRDKAQLLITDIITEPSDFKRITREYYEQLYGNKYDSLYEMDTLLERHILLKLIQEKVENLYCPIYILKIEYILNPHSPTTTHKNKEKILRAQMVSLKIFKKHLRKM